MSRGVLLEYALYLGALLLFVAGFGLPEPAAPEFELGPRSPGTLRVVTWNVGGSNGDGEWGGPLSDEHLEHVASVLLELDPDLCFLQEVRIGRQAQRLRDALGAGWELEYSSSTGGRKVIALAQRGVLEPWKLGVPASCSIGVRYRPQGAEPLSAVGLHADVTSASARNEAIGQLVESLSQIDEPALLVGDFNIDLDLGKRRDLFTDDEYRDVETYNYITRSFEDATLRTGSTAEPDRRLDYIFLAEGRFGLRSAGPLRDRRLGDMDHDPVVADLTR